MGIFSLDAVEKLTMRVEVVMHEMDNLQERVEDAEDEMDSSPESAEARAQWAELNALMMVRRSINQGWVLLLLVEKFVAQNRAGLETAEDQEEYRRLDEAISAYEQTTNDNKKTLSRAMRKLTGKKLLGKWASLTRRAGLSSSHEHHHSQQPHAHHHAQKSHGHHHSQQPHAHQQEQQQPQYQQPQYQQPQYQQPQYQQPQYSQEQPQQQQQYPVRPPHHHYSSSYTSTSSGSFSSASSSMSAATSPNTSADEEDYEQQEHHRQQEKLRRQLAPVESGYETGTGEGKLKKSWSVRKKNSGTRKPKMNVVAVSSSTLIEVNDEEFEGRGYVGSGMFCR